nr:hypothetical protein B11C_200088 [Bartonella sp. 1-1C]
MYNESKYIMTCLPEKFLSGYQSFITNHFTHKVERY